MGDAIRSALDQTWKPIELIVVDDASSDLSASVISVFGESIRIISLESNHGGAFARNRGADAARGDFIVFLDADDLLGSTAVAEMMKTSVRRPGQIIACRFSYLVADDGKWKSIPSRARTYSDDDQLLGWLEGNWSPPCALMWPRQVYDSVGGWNESLTRNDDGDIAMRALASGVRIAGAGAGEVFYRRHRKTRVSMSTMRSSDSHLRSAMRVLTDLSSELERQGRLARYRLAIEEDLAEIATLAFRAGLDTLARETVAIARRRAASGVGNGSRLRDRIYASSVRTRGQARRWIKRRWR